MSRHTHALSSVSKVYPGWHCTTERADSERVWSWKEGKEQSTAKGGQRKDVMSSRQVTPSNVLRTAASEPDNTQSCPIKSECVCVRAHISLQMEAHGHVYTFTTKPITRCWSAGILTLVFELSFNCSAMNWNGNCLTTLHSSAYRLRVTWQSCDIITIPSFV